MHTICNKPRLLVVLSFFIFAFLLFSTRLTYLQIVKYPSFKEQANDQYSFLLTLSPERGVIYDRNMQRLACNLKVESLYAVPLQMKYSHTVTSKLSDILDINQSIISERLKRRKMFIWLKRRLSEEEVKKIKALDVEGLDFVKEYKRFYPNGNFASHILGIVDIDNKGLEGVELLYNEYLGGKPGWKEVVKDAKGRELASQMKRSLPPCNGYNMVLTIDEVIQHIAEKALDKVYRKYKAKAAMVIVMDPQNGEILALANRPSFDPNTFHNSSHDIRRNRAITDCFEPGSSFKIVTASAALNEDAAKPSDVFFCENGSWSIYGHMLHDHTPHGNLTFKEVIEKSSNIGTVKVALRLKDKNFYEYIRRFGFGESTGIDLPGEVSGLLQPLSKWSKFTISSIPMGQEIGVTAIQMACAVSTIANGGIYYKPMIVKKVCDSKGEIIKKFDAEAVKEVISPQAAAKMRAFMRGVVENGTGKAAKLKNYTGAGKTGTGQKLEPSGQYSHSKFTASFVGFAPSENPSIVVCVFIDEPRPLYYGGTVAAPVFKEIAEETLRYLEGGSLKMVKK